MRTTMPTSGGRLTAACAAAATAAALLGAPAHAAGGAAGGDAFGFAVRLQAGTPGADGARNCTGALIGPRVVLTAQQCVAGVTATLTAVAGGRTVRVADVRQNAAPGLALVALASPVTAPTARLATRAAATGERLTAAGLGRTRTTWIPDAPHTVGLDVTAARDGGVDLTPATEGSGLCRGDAGAPIVRSAGDDRYEIVAVATTAATEGCLGSTDTTGAVQAAPVAGFRWAAPGADAYDQLTLTPVDAGRAPTAGAGFGSAVATADFNGDGHLDIAVGAPNAPSAAGAASGTVTVFNGGKNGPSTGRVLSQTEFNAADEAGDRFGAALAVGDFNNDKRADLAVGTPGEVVGTTKAGSIAIFHGSANGLEKARGIDQNDIGRTDGANDEFGAALAAGDFNGDGRADLAVGAPGRRLGGLASGEVVILKGTGTALAAGWTINQTEMGGGDEAGDRFGAALAAGNVVGNKSGAGVYADLVIGVPNEAPAADPSAGCIFVMPGDADGKGAGFGRNQSGNGGVNEAGDRFGAAVAVGDFNKDGWGDVVAGVPGEAPGDLPRSGAMTVFPGGQTTTGKAFTAEPRQFENLGNNAGDEFGSAFATGDVNADGYADLLAGMPGHANGFGALTVFHGGAVTTARPHALTPYTWFGQDDLWGTPEAGDRFTAALALGDLNKDGRADAVVGTPGEAFPGEPAAGAVTTLSVLQVRLSS
ncbi:trypsin-like serine protease [Spirilliplanes yamanashiensis]|uniref:Esterase n=1 Tax=Spirilliplanes yamanashiensis TaxID=42233 RepID=A0A8J3Y6T2_9ACTN|nr:trypsin-like serine protease [Spirilliplanes yamanashiensis]MDP9814713.1 hypothetical protein [Spirilliplanes yamanashiensis]GIJ02365.1 esterase [Spirilliplanes yamanashiensis]